MSGAGIGYGPPPSMKFDCSTGIINTTVSSIDLDLLLTQSVGDILDVELSEIETIILLNGNGETLGAIVHPNTTELIECIKNGNEYKATVISINTTACRVEIKRV